MEILDERDCLELLRSHDLGRVGLMDNHARPLILPVNYYFGEGIVAFHTASGAKLDLAPGRFVCFEIDGWDTQLGLGRSVLARGHARDITEPRGAPTAQIHYWPVEPLAPGSHRHWIGIWVEEISGRRFRTRAEDKSTAR
jgi:nitroimidazol reductase NimA-like FMN-containing flavoprotein (pyridoxamine 5'-phosphate oxidase superfamily)